MRPTPVVLVTIVALIVIYLATGFARLYVPGGDVAYDNMILTTSDVLGGQVWRLFTYGLVHSLQDPVHVAFNALTLFFFGRDLELRFGRWRFVAFLAVSVVIGGLFVVAAGVLGIGTGASLGFSGACEACVVAWALFNKNVMMWPIPVPGIWMLTYALLMWMMQAVSQSNISAAAHLGGIVFGAAVWFFVARRNRIKLFFDDALVKLRIRRGPRLTVVPKNDRWVN
jgi:membrane associated rhomboid family serine protease